MSHPFGELLKQYRRRKPGLSQERLAHRIGYDQAVLVRMSQGKKDLTGPSGRDRVVRLIEVLHEDGVLQTLDEANALLATASLPPLYEGLPLERTLIQMLRPPQTAATAVHIAEVHYRLPTAVSSFVGREHEIEQIGQALSRSRLVTLVGAGGSGKTRLALEAGLKQANAFANGVCFIGLAAVRHAEDVVPVIARALDVRESPDVPVLESIKRFLANKSVLLLLDNFEHVLDQAAVVTEILAMAPRVKVLATSREPLRLNGEQLFDVEPLALPSAVELFAQRTRLQTLKFKLDEDTRPVVEEICRRMDCLPLAIELAAGRMRQFSPADLLAHLNGQRSLSVLTDAPRDAPTRHQTLRHAIAWSYDLLNQGEKQVLRHLSIFAGGAEAEQLEAVLSPMAFSNVARALASLTEKNLVRVIAQPDVAVRYDLLELIREFACMELNAQGELRLAQQRHAETFAMLAEQSCWPMRGHGQLQWMDRLDREFANLHAALDWSFGPDGDARLGCRLTAGLGYFWYIASGHQTEAIYWFKQSERVDPKELLPQVRGEWIFGKLLVDAPAEADFLRLAHEAVDIYARLNDKRSLALANSLVALSLVMQNLLEPEGLRFIEESERLAYELQDEWLIAINLLHRAVHAHDQKDLETAEGLYRKMVAARRASGNIADTAVGLWQLAGLLMERGQFHEALDHLHESIIISQRFGNVLDEVIARRMVGECHQHLSQFESAMRTLEGAIALAQERLSPDHAIRSMISLAKTMLAAGHFAQSRAVLVDVMSAMQTHQWSELELRIIVQLLAVVLCETGQPLQAAQLWGAVEPVSDIAQRPLPPRNLWDTASSVAKARAALGDAVYEAAYAEGHAMPLEQAIAYALAA